MMHDMESPYIVLAVMSAYIRKLVICDYILSQSLYTGSSEVEEHKALSIM
jgi:hypothetical protein